MNDFRQSQPSSCEKELKEQPLGIEDGTALRKLFQHLYEKKGISYKSQANRMNLDVKSDIYPITGGRSNGNELIKTRSIALCSSFQIDWDTFYNNSIKHIESDIKQGNILNLFGIDQETIRRSVEILTGKYILFTLVGENKINATWYLFRGPSASVPLPRYSGWRRNKNFSISRFSGYYYLTGESLNLISPDKNGRIRTFSLAPDYESQNPTDRYGFSVGSSEEHPVFNIPSYLKRISTLASRRHHIHVIGERTIADTKEHAPNIPGMLSRLSMLPFMVTQSSTP